MDAIYVGLTGLFFAASAWLVRLLGGLGGAE
jgi:hypothetical protein